MLELKRPGPESKILRVKGVRIGLILSIYEIEGRY